MVNVSDAAPQSRPSVGDSGGRTRFPRTARLLRHADFERVYKQGKRHFAAHMTVFYLRRTSGDGPRVGFTVGKAIGNAVARNRVRRRLREGVRLHRSDLLAPVDIVINPKRSALIAQFSDLENQIRRAFEVVGKSIGHCRSAEWTSAKM
jgi:ribonuclease P protein component